MSSPGFGEWKDTINNRLEAAAIYSPQHLAELLRAAYGGPQQTNLLVIQRPDLKADTGAASSAEDGPHKSDYLSTTGMIECKLLCLQMGQTIPWFTHGSQEPLILFVSGQVEGRALPVRLVYPHHRNGLLYRFGEVGVDTGSNSG